MSAADHNIVLIGPMGSGKTTIGRLLAARLRLPFVDSDTRITEVTGVDIPTIFAIEGENGFREREHRTLRDIASEPAGKILATGGGAILDPRNRALLRTMGEVIYLDVGVDEQLRRLRHDRHRPLLQVENLPGRLQDLASQRVPFYLETAHFRIVGDRLRSDQVLRRILRYLQQRSVSS